MNATIFDIKRFAVHDGPGIRTTLFIKGCPLNCKWCHNPEGLEAQRQLWYFQNQCLKCGDCVSVCPEGVLTLEEDGIRINRELCTSCGRCTGVCPTGALHFIGDIMDADTIEEELLKDLPFYEESGGGITLSGGEPLSRPELVREILTRMKGKGIHTVVETSLFTSSEVLRSLIPLVDMFLSDIKIIDSAAHKEHAGVPNEQILENFRILADSEREVLVRIPVIPGFTDAPGNLEGIADFLCSLSRKLPVELMNFNPLARDKFRILGRPYEPADGDKPYSDEAMEAFRDIFRKKGLAVK
ncbi:MAG: glycyl-radical enzyme activating protein [Spirochaetales bacterium]|nr:glycyl-radical enzyme activating protein [Spirochaetales bacterium]